VNKSILTSGSGYNAGNSTQNAANGRTGRFLPPAGRKPGADENGSFTDNPALFSRHPLVIYDKFL
jgi:hypothetical protein